MPCELLSLSRLPGSAAGLALASRSFQRVGGCDAWNDASESVRVAALGAEFDSLVKSCSGEERSRLASARGRMIASGKSAKACTSLLGDLVKTFAPVAALGVGLGVALPKVLGKAGQALGENDVAPPIVSLTDNAQAGPPNPNTARASVTAKAPTSGPDTGMLAIAGIGVLFAVGLVFAFKTGG
jgi:hypothetical protein